MKILPEIEWLTGEEKESVFDKALEILKKTGVLVESGEARSILKGGGAETDGGRVFIPERTVSKALETAQDRVFLFDRGGEQVMNLGGRELHFNPGSSAVHILDYSLGGTRRPASRDLVDFARLTDSLPGYDAQSTALVPGDVPENVADSYRLYLALIFSAKPVVTGVFTVDGFEPMRKMLEAVAGGEDRLRVKPNAVFDCCPTSPLLWSRLATSALVECARFFIPAQIVPMPLSGATSPATLAGTLIQHCAENLSGIVIHQLAAPGAPVIYGGSPAYFDMRQGTTPMGAIESLMLNGAAASMAEYIGVPSHAYMALSDSSSIDYQSGMETGMGALVAAMSGINNVSGPGMHGFQTCQSMEKLVLDHEVCLMARRLKRGIDFSETGTVRGIIEEGIEKGSFLAIRNTLECYRKEAFFPHIVIDRCSPESEAGTCESDIIERASKRVRELLEGGSRPALDGDRRKRLEGIMLAEAANAGLEELPPL